MTDYYEQDHDTDAPLEDEQPTHRDRLNHDREYGEIVRDHLATLKAIRAGRSQLSRGERQQVIKHVLYQRYVPDEFYHHGVEAQELVGLARGLAEKYGVGVGR